VIDRTLIKNNKKFLLHCTNSSISDLFISECKSVYSDYSVEYCPDISSFSELLNRGSLFSDSKSILVLSNLLDEDVQDLGSVITCDTEDILVLIERSTLKKNKAYTNLKSSFTYIKLEDLPEKDCRSWLHLYMTGEGLNFASNIPQFIIDKRGTDIGCLVNEVDKLKLLGQEITESLCNLVVSTDSEANLFVVSEHFFHRRFKECLKEFDKVEEGKYISLLHLLLSQVEKLYKIAIYREQKKDTEEIADLINLPRFILQTKYYTVLSIFNKVKLLKILDLLNDLDLKLRLCQFDKKVLFEIYISKVFKL